MGPCLSRSLQHAQDDTFPCQFPLPEYSCASPSERQVRELITQFPEQVFWRDLLDDCPRFDEREIALNITAIWWLQMDAVLQEDPSLLDRKNARDALRFDYVQQVKSHQNEFNTAVHRQRRPLLIELLRQCWVSVRVKLGFSHPW